MSIIASETVTRTEPGPLLRVRHLYHFHNGQMGRVRFDTDNMSLDVDADRVARIPQLEARARDDEIRQLVEDVVRRAESGRDVDIMAITPEHQETDDEATRQRRFRRALVRQAMRHRDLKVVRRLFYAVWYWAKFTQGYTGQQIADYLNVPLAVISAIDSRMQAIHDNLAFVDGDAEFEVD